MMAAQINLNSYTATFRGRRHWEKRLWGKAGQIQCTGFPVLPGNAHFALIKAHFMIRREHFGLCSELGLCSQLLSDISGGSGGGG